MEAKKLDATVLDSPQTVQARRMGFRVLAEGAESGIPFLQGGLVTRRAYIKSNEDTVRRTIRVIVAAIHYAKTYREAAPSSNSTRSRVKRHWQIACNRHDNLAQQRSTLEND
jgi:ABC-type nitrate/sulfonate/bicarbonate transport system substrate-binding protein